MPTTLTGALLSSYRDTIKYDQVLQLTNAKTLPSNHRLRSTCLVDDYLVVLSESTTKTYSLTFINVNTQIKVLSKDLVGLTDPILIPLEDGILLLSKPGSVTKLRLTNGSWGELETEALSSDLPS